MEKRSLLFKQDMKIKDKEYLSGYAYELELEPYEFDRLTRQGCIYAGKDAKYYQETKEIEVAKPVERKSKKKKSKVSENVDNQYSEQAEVQTDNSDNE